LLPIALNNLLVMNTELKGCGAVAVVVYFKLMCRCSSGALSPNLGYAYPKGYEQEHLGVREKKLNIGGKGHVRQHCRTRYKSKVVK